MKTEIYKITNPETQTEEIKAVAKLLQDGEAVAIPTETVYGIAADCFNESAVAKIFEAKGRPSDNPLIVHISEFSQLYTLVKEVPDEAKELARRYWPGPLTIILPKKECVSDRVSGGLKTVAVRMPSHPVARAIISAAGVPLAAPSANISGFPSPTSPEYVIDDMDTRLPAIVDGGECDFGIESTVVSLAENPPVLLRPGAVTHAQLTEVLGEVKIHSAVLSPLDNNSKATSPGMKYKHYSPTAKLTVFDGNITQYVHYLKNHSEFDYALCFEEEKDIVPVPSVTFGSADDPFSQAKRLFDSFRELDRMNAANVLVRSPSKEGVGLGVCNRLYRACGFNFIKAETGGITGISGGSGSGKSYVCKLLEKEGFVKVDADEISKSLTKKGSPVLEILASYFGEDIIKDGELDRHLLAQRAFSSDEKRSILNKIMHPEIIKKCKEKAVSLSENGEKVLLDAPLLFTTGLDKICDITVRVYAPDDIRIKRITKRDNIPESDALLRLSGQKEEEAAAENADITLFNFPPYEIEKEILKLV